MYIFARMQVYSNHGDEVQESSDVWKAVTAYLNEDTDDVKCYINMDDNVDLKSPVRHFDKWNDQVKKLASNVRAVLEDKPSSRMILYGKSPLACFTLLGAYVKTPPIIVNEFPYNSGTWQVFDLHKDFLDNTGQHHKSRHLLAKKRRPIDSTVAKSQKKKYFLLFVTLDTYDISDEQFEKINKEIEQEDDGVIATAVRMAPASEKKMPLSPSTKAPEESEIDTAALSYIIWDVYDQIEMFVNVWYYAGVIVIPSGPAPVAYMLGTYYRPSAHGKLLLYEMVNGNYVRAASINREEED